MTRFATKTDAVSMLPGKKPVSLADTRHLDSPDLTLNTTDGGVHRGLCAQDRVRYKARGAGICRVLVDADLPIGSVTAAIRRFGFRNLSYVDGLAYLYKYGADAHRVVVLGHLTRTGNIAVLQYARRDKLREFQFVKPAAGQPQQIIPKGTVVLVEAE